jgi:hypothetical protein
MKGEQAALTKAFKNDSEKCLEASVKVSYRIACQGEAHVIGEKLIKPCIMDVAETMLDSKAVTLLNSIPLSNDTVKRRIGDCADHVEEVLISRLKLCKYFVLQFDESTDCAGLAILIVFVRYFFENIIYEDLLFCKPLESHTTGKDVFEIINNYFTEKGLSWEKCIDVCTDGAPAMVGRLSGAVTRIKQVAANCTSSHCMLHREALATKSMPVEMKTVLDTSVKIVNCIKCRPLASRLFHILCNEMGSQYESLLYHTEVRWLSRGNVLRRVFDLKDEINVFYATENPNITQILHDIIFLQRLAYLSDIFSKLNELNISMQGRTVHIFSARDKINSMKKKLLLWCQRVSSNDTECFECLHSFLEENEIPVDAEVKQDIVQHLKQLKQSLDGYFPTDNESFEWLISPFLCEIREVKLPVIETEQLIEISCDSFLKQKFTSTLLPTFWSELIPEYPEIATRAIKKLLPFPTTYLCESAFSCYFSTKTKYRNKLNAEADMRLQLSSIQPDFKKIVSTKQAQKSH